MYMYMFIYHGFLFYMYTLKRTFVYTSAAYIGYMLNLYSCKYKHMYALSRFLYTYKYTYTTDLCLAKSGVSCRRLENVTASRQ